MLSEHAFVHMLAGGLAGTAGAVVTCPLDVVKTRLQSSVATFNVTAPKSVYITNASYSQASHVFSIRHLTYSLPIPVKQRLILHRTDGPPSIGLFRCFKHIIQQEGGRALFKGLLPTLLGVVPYRAIYFYTYSNAKQVFNSVIVPYGTPDSHLVHILSATCGGFAASTCTNPVWFVKTRLQLDQKRQGRLSVFQCVRQVYSQHGIVGFYKGVSASYYGISETVIHFVIYEAIKKRIRDMRSRCFDDDHLRIIDFVEYMGAGATSKTIATCLTYPYEVARTRLRQEGSKYRTFWQTLRLVYKEEGRRGMYRGIVTQLLRQIPNTAIVMSTYEAIVYLLRKPPHKDD